MTISRRQFTRNLMLATGAGILPMRSGWALAMPQPVRRRLIVVLMRGAVDGLNVVVPFREQNYYRIRSSIALRPQEIINLDNFFGMHPSLSPLTPLWQNRSLAFIHASGSTAETRSHFEAQDILETAMLNSALANQGWMNGLAQILPENQSPTRALSFGNVLPKIFQGRFNVASVPVGIKGKNNPNDRAEDPRMEQVYDRLYANDPRLQSLYKGAVTARDTMMTDLQGEDEITKEMENSGRGAAAPDAFSQQALQAAEMIRRDPAIQLVFMDVGGWDTHVRQGNAKGQLATKLEKFSQGLAVLAEHLGPAYKDTAILVMSEFGRTAAENGNGGTDHGHGNVAWLMGGGVQGGKVWGQWPGLNPNQLHEGRDLAVTTDFRSLIGAVIAGQFGIDDGHLAKIIPGYEPDNQLRGIV